MRRKGEARVDLRVRKTGRFGIRDESLTAVTIEKGKGLSWPTRLQLLLFVLQEDFSPLVAHVRDYSKFHANLRGVGRIHNAITCL